ncbi:MAG: GntR family transcriptional regulator [Pseudomonadota bacterium]
MVKSELTRQALDVLRQAQVPLGFHIGEQWLANALGVSRSPARRVLRQLEALGLVKSEPNQGFYLCVPAEDLTVDPAELPDSESERLYRQIAQERFANILGAHISVAELVHRYGVNRTVITKVLSRMAEHGLVAKSAGHAWAFSSVLSDEASIAENHRFRMILEPAAILEPGFEIPHKRLMAVIATHEHICGEGIFTKSAANYFEIDEDFHNTIADCCGNRFIAQAIRQQTHLRRLPEFETYLDRRSMQASLRQHLKILRAIQKGDMHEAAAAMTDHIQAAKGSMSEVTKMRTLAHRRLTRR